MRNLHLFSQDKKLNPLLRADERVIQDAIDENRNNPAPSSGEQTETTGNQTTDTEDTLEEYAFSESASNGTDTDDESEPKSPKK